jgi:hypothetical protein
MVREAYHTSGDAAIVCPATSAGHFRNIHPQPLKHPQRAQRHPLAWPALLLYIYPHFAVIAVFELPTALFILLGEHQRDGILQARLSASASMPSSAARAIYFSRWGAPSNRLKLEWQCDST